MKDLSMIFVDQVSKIWLILSTFALPLTLFLVLILPLIPIVPCSHLTLLAYIDSRNPDFYLTIFFIIKFTIYSWRVEWKWLKMHSK